MESGSGAKPPDSPGPGFGPGAPGYGPGGEPPDRSPADPQSPSAPGSPSGPQSPAGPGSPSERQSPPSGPQSPAGPSERQSPGPGESQPPPYAPPAAPRGPETPGPSGAPAYGGPVPPGGWQQPLGRGPAPPLGPLASWGSRVGAYLIDALVLLVPGAILFVVIVGGAVGLTGTDDDVAWGAAIGAFILFVLLFAIVVLLYAPLLMIRTGERNGQTWGKQLVGIRAVRDSGEPWTFGPAALREVVLKNLAVGIASSIVPFVPWFLNFFWPLWDDQNRALHDMAASSHVVRA